MPQALSLFRGAGKRFSPLIPAAILLLAVHSAAALDPNRQLSQYAHSAWRTQEGEFGGTPIVMAQTADGYLWLGTNIGLVRYNGSRFLPWTPPSGKRLLDSRIFALAAAPDGSLWIGTGSGPAHWKDGQLTNYPRPDGRTEAIISDPGSGAWIARTQSRTDMGPLCHLTGSSYRCYTSADGVPFESATKVVADASGNMWIGSYAGLGRWKNGSSTTYFPRDPKNDIGIGSVKDLATGTDGSIWVSLESSGPVLRLEQFQNGSWTTHFYPQIRATNADVMAIFIDRDNFLWVGTAHTGIFRIRGTRVEHFGSQDGLSSDAIGSFFQDREGTVWVVTSAGVDNFRDMHIENFDMREGMYADGASSLFAGRDGTIWVGNFQSLSFLRDGRLSSIIQGRGLPGLNVTTLLEDHAGRLWVGIDNGFWVYENGSFRAIRHADGSPLGITFTICEDVDHSIWVRSGPNLDHIVNYRVQEEATSKEIVNTYILAAHPAGGLIMGTVTGDIVRYKNGKATTLPGDDELPEDGRQKKDEDPGRHVRDLIVQPDGSIWGTTVEEFFMWRNGRRESLNTSNGLPCDNIFALADDHRGSLWLSTACGLIRISNDELNRWWNRPHSQVKATLAVGMLDGVQPGLTSLKPQLVIAPDGKIWMVNGRILQMYDPNDRRRNEIAPPVHIEQIVADRKVYAPQSDLRIPPRTRDLQINYAALSFVVPKKVLYRYKLEGRDKDWQDPENRNEAFYRDLSPGNYRFIVIACNNDGVWNETGAQLSFFVEYAYYQTEWFRLLCAVLTLSILWFLYRLRLWRMHESLNARFDERMAERTRLARELHDTLLQTIQGSKMVADDALENSGDSGTMRHALERLSRWLDQATEEGRAALNSLRTSTTQVNDLAQAFDRAARECSTNSGMQYTLQVDGAAEQMHPIVRDEVYRIGYEAIRNACSHSGGTLLEVDLSYSRDLILRVRDNGGGIHPDIAASGRDGHFGLKGMQERALRVGGTLTLSSSGYSGTEVELIVPSDVVFYRSNANRHGTLAQLRGLLRRGRSSKH